MSPNTHTNTEPITIRQVLNIYPNLRETFLKKEYSHNKTFSFKEIVKELGEERVLPVIHYFYRSIPEQVHINIAQYLTNKVVTYLAESGLSDKFPERYKFLVNMQEGRTSEQDALKYYEDGKKRLDPVGHNRFDSQIEATIEVATLALINLHYTRVWESNIFSIENLLTNSNRINFENYNRNAPLKKEELLHDIYKIAIK